MLRVISGGQTGVDRAGLDAARTCLLEIGGWCPKGRLAEDGKIPEEYPLTEAESPAYPQRTEWNVRDSDATIILTCGRYGRGTTLTMELAKKLNKPVLLIQLKDRKWDCQATRDWIVSHKVQTLNIAGPRASNQPEVYDLARNYLTVVFSYWT